MLKHFHIRVHVIFEDPQNWTWDVMTNMIRTREYVLELIPLLPAIQLVVVAQATSRRGTVCTQFWLHKAALSRSPTEVTSWKYRAINSRASVCVCVRVCVCVNNVSTGVRLDNPPGDVYVRANLLGGDVFNANNCSGGDDNRVSIVRLDIFWIY